jgi:hypothetical protein
MALRRRPSPAAPADLIEVAESADSLRLFAAQAGSAAALTLFFGAGRNGRACSAERRKICRRAVAASQSARGRGRPPDHRARRIVTRRHSDGRRGRSGVLPHRGSPFPATGAGRQPRRELPDASQGAWHMSSADRRSSLTDCMPRSLRRRWAAWPRRAGSRFSLPRVDRPPVPSRPPAPHVRRARPALSRSWRDRRPTA